MDYRMTCNMLINGRGFIIGRKYASIRERNDYTLNYRTVAKAELTDEMKAQLAEIKAAYENEPDATRSSRRTSAVMDLIERYAK